MAIVLRPVVVSDDRDRLIQFLCGDEWPYHARRKLTPDDVDSIDFVSTNATSFWVHDDSGPSPVGLVRAFDLDDVGDGAPLIDVRVASSRRGRGVGTEATSALVDHVVVMYPDAHRIEATTRHDNVAMQSVLRRVGFVEEGRLRDAWWSSDGEWYDTLVFGLLRRDRAPVPGGPGRG